MKCFTPYGRASLDNLGSDLEYLKTLGLSPEVFLPGNLLDSLDDEMLSPLLHWKEEGRDLTFHAPFADLSPGGVDSRVLDVTRFRFNQVMDLAERVQPGQVLFHPGFDNWRFAFREDLWIENSLKIWSELLDRAARIRVRVVLENVFDPRPDHLVRLRERLGGEIHFCLDTGHLNLFSEVPTEQWVKAFDNGLAELHLHDNDGREDLHLPVGEGEFDFSRLLRKVDSKGLTPVTVLEHHSKEETSRSLTHFQNLIRRISLHDRPRS